MVIRERTFRHRLLLPDGAGAFVVGVIPVAPADLVMVEHLVPCRCALPIVRAVTGSFLASPLRHKDRQLLGKFWKLFAVISFVRSGVKMKCIYQIVSDPAFERIRENVRPIPLFA